MRKYLALLRDVLYNGVPKTSRTGVDTIAVEGREMRFDIREYQIPAVTTRKLGVRGGVLEDLWMLGGDTSIGALKSLGINFWDQWVLKGTEVEGPRYWAALDLEVKKKGGEELLARWVKATEHKRTRLVYPYIGRGAVSPDEEEEVEIREEYDINVLGLADGKLGPVYGEQWRYWQDTRVVHDYLENEASYKERGYALKGEFFDHTKGCDAYVIHRVIDQVDKVVKSLRTNPDGRRHMLINWNVSALDEMALEPCHYSFQLLPAPLSRVQRVQLLERTGYLIDTTVVGRIDDELVDAVLAEHNIPKYRLTGKVVMRSSDVPVGLPTNLIGYAALTMMFAKVCNMAPHELIWSGGDVHIYADQIELAKQQLEREPLEQTTYLLLNPDVQEIDDFTAKDFKIVGYKSHPPIDYPVAV